MQLLLQRYCYSEKETEGLLWLNNDESLYTLERPWIDEMPGGMSFESCVPDGEYELIPHTRPNGDSVLALRNTYLDVYYTEQERGNRDGRYLILFHSANWVEQVVGCIAPGMTRTIADNKRMVRSSRLAMNKIMAGNYSSVLIEQAPGAVQ